MLEGTLCQTQARQNQMGYHSDHRNAISSTRRNFAEDEKNTATHTAPRETRGAHNMQGTIFCQRGAHQNNFTDDQDRNATKTTHSVEIRPRNLRVLTRTDP